MRSKSVYEQIKKQNGEGFARELRRFDSGIFEIENLPHILKYAGSMSEPLFDFLEMLKNIEIEEVKNPQNPFDLLKKAGYDAFLADTHQKQNSVWQYFTKEERLCTFDDANRFQNYYIIYAIKEGAHKLNRSDFLNPEREDEYGASVISIQIAKRGGFIKITNRYNHTVPFPDNTFKSNPDNIIEGLSSALKHHFKVDFSSVQTPLPEGYIFVNGQIVAYDYEQDGIYFGDNFFVENGKITPINKDYQFIFDCFILDLKEKKVLNPFKIIDSLPEVLEKEFKTKKRLFVKKKDKYFWQLIGDDKVLLDVEYNRLKTVYLPETEYIRGVFISYKSKVNSFMAPKLKYLGRKSLCESDELKRFVADSLLAMGEYCVCSAVIDFLHIPRIKKMGDCCFSLLTPRRKGYMKEVVFPFLVSMGNHCFTAYEIEKLQLASCQKIGDFFAAWTSEFKSVYLPELRAFPKNSALNEKVRGLYAPFLIQSGKKLFLNSVRNVFSRCND